MPRWNSALNAKLKAYEKKLDSKKCQPRTKTEYRRLITTAFEALRVAGLACTVKTIGEEEIDFLYNELYEPIDPHTARNQLSVIGTFLKRMGNNPIVENMEIPWPQDLRIHAKWVQPMQQIALRRAAIGLQRILIHCEMDLLMRRCEVIRLRMQDIGSGSIDIWGKGKNGGKPRTVPWHPRTAQEFTYYLQLRTQIIEEARRKDPCVVVPDALLIYEQNGTLGAYQKTAIDRMIKEAGAAAGFQPEDISNHPLRRGGARTLLLAGTPLTTIMRILGHSSEQQTVKYLGLDLDDMSKGMMLAEQYIQGLEKLNPIIPKSGTSPIIWHGSQGRNLLGPTNTYWLRCEKARFRGT